MKKILNKPQVTVWGGSGFIGSHVSDILTKKNFRVIIADKVKSKWIRKSQKMFIGDVTKYSDVEKSLKNSKFVFNFAGIADIEIANKNLIDTINQNILGNANILKACNYHNINVFQYNANLGHYLCHPIVSRMEDYLSCNLLVKYLQHLYYQKR